MNTNDATAPINCWHVETVSRMVQREFSTIKQVEIWFVLINPENKIDTVLGRTIADKQRGIELAVKYNKDRK